MARADGGVKRKRSSLDCKSLHYSDMYAVIYCMSYVEPRYDPYQVGLTQHGPSGVLSIKTKCYKSNYSKKKKSNKTATG